MLASKSSTRVLTALLGVALGVIGFDLIPVYGAPFAGCSGSGWLTLTPGCSVWPEIARGAALMLPIVLLTPRAWNLPWVAVAGLFALSLFGGIGGVLAGDHLSISRAGDIYSAFLLGYPNLLGGMVVVLCWAGTSLIKSHSPTQLASGTDS